MTKPAFNRCKRGFTLMEVLVVTALVGILAALSLPSISLLRAWRLGMGADAVANLADLARQTSVVRNTPTALVVMVVPRPDGDEASSVGLFELEQPADGTPSQPADWKQVTPWKALPQGVTIDANAAVSTFLDSPSFSPALPPMKLNGKPASLQAHQVFLPSGQLAASTATFPKLRLSMNNSNYYDISLNIATGRVMIGRP